jgi:hypothetical protein
MNYEKHWKRYYGDQEWAMDYANRLICLDAYGDLENIFGWNLDHIRPKSQGGKDNAENIIPVHYATNMEKDDKFPLWDANGRRFKAVKKVKNNPRKGYNIINDGELVQPFENID